MGTERQTNAIRNNIGYVHFACSEGSKVRRLFQKWRMAQVLWPTETAPNEASTYMTVSIHMSAFISYISLFRFLCLNDEYLLLIDADIDS